MPDAIVEKRITIGSDQYLKRQTIDSNAGMPFDRSIPAAKTGTLTTRTDNTSGTLTMTAGHGFITGNKIDLYWTDPTTGNMMRRYQVVCGTVATNSVPISGGTGDNLPLAASAITAMVPVSQTLPVTGDNVVAIAVKSPVGGVFAFALANNTVVYVLTVTPVNQSDGWTTFDGTNPVAGQAVAGVFLSHPDSTAARTMSGEVLYN